MTPSSTAVDLYRPEFEHDACGVAFVVDMHGRRSHQIVRMGLDSLCHLEHRGASGAETNTGDGAGILVQIPDRLYREVAGFALPEAGAYATGIGFLPVGDAAAEAARRQVEHLAGAEDLIVLGWREVPIDASPIGSIARGAMPSFHQVFLASPAGHRGLDLERRAFILRKRIEHELTGVYFPSLSARTVIYKGMLTAPQVEVFYPDLTDERLESALALVHSRFSTNTFPSWPLAHPYRYLAHNGEINTLQGNRNWMRAREDLLASDLFPGDLDRIFPIITPGRQRFGQLRRGARTAAPRRALPPPCGAHDDSRSLGAAPPHGRGQTSLLPVPRCRDGALGRAGIDCLHRWHLDRSRSRSQWTAALPLLGYRRRPGGHGVRGRGPRHRTGPGCGQGAPAARPDVPRGHQPGPDRRRRGDQVGPGRRTPLRRVAGPQADPFRRAARPDSR